MTTESITQAELSRRLNRTARQIRKLNDRGIPRNEDGTYPWPEAQEWWVKFKQGEKDRRGLTPSKEPSELDRARAAKEWNLAELRRLELEEKLGNLVSIDFMDAQLAAALQRTRQVLNTLPGKIAPLLVGCATVPRAQMILQQAIDEAMPSLQAIGDDDDDGDALEGEDELEE